MIFEVTPYNFAAEFTGSFSSCLFVERPWRKNDAEFASIDLDQLARWLNGDSSVRPDAPGPSPAVHLISSEHFREQGMAAQFAGVLRTYENERPDILRVVYEPSLRFIPWWPGQPDKMLSEIDRRTRDAVESEILARTSIVAVDQYVFGVCGRIVCPTCASGTVDDVTTIDLAATWSNVPRIMAGASAVYQQLGRPFGATIADIFVPGLGKFPNVIPMGVDFWAAYVAEAKKHYRWIAWWKSLDLIDGRYQWASRDSIIPLAAAAAGAVAKADRLTPAGVAKIA